MTQQLLTPQQSQCAAWLLTRRAASDSVESLVSSTAILPSGTSFICLTTERT
jgi:hypothetical protein